MSHDFIKDILDELKVKLEELKSLLNELQSPNVQIIDLERRIRKVHDDIGLLEI